jgi:uncharacterized delta-60 repeat protein
MARRSRPTRFAALLAGAALAAGLGATVVTTNSWAAAGVLDPTFGSAGTVNTAGQGDARAVVLQPDGKLVAAGSSRVGSSWQFGLARYDARGALDPGFGSSGLATTTIGTRSWASALVLQPDGKLVAAGLGDMDANGANGVLALARFNGDGTLDATFGTKGTVTSAISTTAVQDALLLQPDGKLVVVGETRQNGVDVFALARYNGNGTVDPTFGSGGTVTTLVNVDSFALAAALQPDGKVVAVGSAQGPGGGFGVARYNADGTLDRSFGSGGTVTTPIGSNTVATANAVTVAPDGKLAVAGSAYRPDPATGPSTASVFAVARYNPDGTLDPTFGSAGTVTTPIGPSAEANAVVLQKDGKLIAVGYDTGLSRPYGNQFALARYNTNGSLDTTFGTAGTISTLVGAGNTADAALLQPDGKLVAAGAGGGDPQTGSGGGVVLARYTLDASTTTSSTTTTTAPSTATPAPGTTPGAASPAPKSGYWMVTTDGHVSGFGDASDLGGKASPDAVHIEGSPTGDGYWILSGDGAVTAHGDAKDLGGADIPAGEHAVSLSATADGDGYWIFTDKGRAIPKGGARFFGDMSASPLNGAVLGSVATPSGNGYWMVASDGGIFSFGDAQFHGSTGSRILNKPVMAMAPAPDGRGYWLVASDGGIFAFDVPFYGSMGSTPLNKPISGMVPGRSGYMMVGQDGGIFSFGDVAFHGSLGSNPPGKPVVSVALQP